MNDAGNCDGVAFSQKARHLEPHDDILARDRFLHR
jgi:hypothetical protein